MAITPVAGWNWSDRIRVIPRQNVDQATFDTVVS